MLRATLLVADIVFGISLLAVALAGRFDTPQRSAATSNPTPPRVAWRFSGVVPPGQSTGMAVAPDGSLAVVDRGREVIQRLDANGQPTALWGPDFGGGLTANDLVGIAPDGDGWAVLDRGASRILRLDAQGRAQADRTIDLSQLATYGPNGLAADGHGNLYMADTGRDRLVVFNSGGAMVGAIGDAGNDLGKFKQPMFLAFAPDGAFYVSDWENSRVERFDANGHASNAWPVPMHAWGIAVDAAGRVFAPDVDHHLVRMFGSDGGLLAEIGADGSQAIPLDGVSQVGVSPDDRWLWVLGNDGLARVDLGPFVALKPTAPVQVPLVVLGAMLVLIGVAGVLWPYRVRVPVRGGTPRRAARGPTSRQAVLPSVPEPVPPVTSVSSVSPARVAKVGAVLLVVGGLAAIGAELVVSNPAAIAAPWPRMAALAVASLIFAAGCLISCRALPWRWVSGWPGCSASMTRTPRLERVAVLVAGLVAGALGLVAGVQWWQGRFQTPEATRAAVLWLAALVLTVGVLATSRSVGRPTLWTLIPWALFVLALLPRAWSNATLPYGVWYDEAEAGLQARRFLQSGGYTPITDTYGRDASLFYYGILAAQQVFSDPVEAGRLVAAFVGALCAPAMYFLGRELFGWRVGLVAALVLATQRWHLDVSRLGWDPISLPLCAILAFWLLARAVRTGRWRDVAWAGLALGLGMHAYIGFRVLPIVGLILLIYGGWRRGWRPLAFAGRLGLALGAACLAALPVIVFAVQDPAAFNGRVHQTLILEEPVSRAQQLNELWTNLQKHVLMFHIQGDANGRHNLPNAPMLDPLSGLLLAIGLAILILRPFDWRAWLVFGWAVASMAGGIFTIPYEAPQAMRTLGVTPVLALVVALALVLVVDRGVAYATRAPRWAEFFVKGGAAAACGLVLWIGAANLVTFFGRQMNDPTVWESFSTRETLPSRAAQQAAVPYEAILGSQTIAPSLEQQLLVPSIQNTIRTFDSTSDLPYRGAGPGLIVLESEHDTGLADAVARYYPDAQRTPVLPPNGSTPTAYEFRLDPNVIAAHRGLAAGRQPDSSYRVDLTIDTPGAYAFELLPGSSLTLDGAPVGGQALELVPGNHLLVLSGASTPDLAWRPPYATAFEPIDPRLLFGAPAGGNGLLATFYPTLNFTGSPTDSTIDPVLAHYYHLSPFTRPRRSFSIWSAEWIGTLDVPTTGDYRFDADRLSRAGLWIDDRVVFDETPDAASASGGGVAASVPLTAGRHAIRVRLQERNDGGPRLYLYWTPPDGSRQLVPSEDLYPPPPSAAQ